MTDIAKPPIANRASQLLNWFFRAWILALVFYNFSENTVDPDLWGHALFGQEMIASSHLDKVEPYSWTTNRGPWINHEVLAEIALGGAHMLMGGTGIWLLTLLVGLATFVIALRIGLQNLAGGSRALVWAIGALAVVEIAFGFAARPQIFTALGLAILIWLLRQIHNGKKTGAFALPVLFLFWINTHGGVLAGIVLLFGAAGASTLQFLWRKKNVARNPSNSWPSTLDARLLVVLWIAFGFSFAALFLNPWNGELVRWLIKSVSWSRPEIEEWNPPQLGWDHGPMFILVALAAIAFLLSRRRKHLWEIGFCAVLAVIALRSVRHTPLFSIAALAIIPPHLADVLIRFREHFARLKELFSRTAVQYVVACILALATVATLYASMTMRKEHPFTMEAPRNQYPVEAVHFIREYDLKGNMLAFFDWGEMVLWQLPNCSPSIDGRLDTCYSRKVISAHWNFYNGEPVDPGALEIARADLALLPAKLVGTINLSKAPGWKTVYADPLAVILVRDVERFPKLAGIFFPVIGSEEALRGREAFPRANPRLQQKRHVP
ncbi:MAG: hypothetical protein ABIR24_09085 [Verrucomicrobiota bacterium]